MKKHFCEIKGEIAVEACVTVLLFLLLMLTLSGLLKMFMAQNITAHAMIQSAKSLSIDAYAGSLLGNDGDLESVGDILNAWIGNSVNQPGFTTHSNWSDEGAELKIQNGAIVPVNNRTIEPAEELRTRFFTYIGGGDMRTVETLFKDLNVGTKVDDFDFSETKVEGGVLYASVKYRLNYPFHIGPLKDVEVHQNVHVNIWRSKGPSSPASEKTDKYHSDTGSGSAGGGYAGGGGGGGGGGGW
ncbi:MAG: hypothetical protein MJ063_01195 [Lachnospiraceae bacterium]|nr:hypothetical protein [Lachnospiraceae bacterium]